MLSKSKLCCKFFSGEFFSCKFFSGVTAFARAGMSSRVDTQISQNLQSQSLSVDQSLQLVQEQIQSLQEAQSEHHTIGSYLKEGISTILMFAGAISGGLGGSFGASIGNILVVGGVSAEGINDLKDMFSSLLKRGQYEKGRPQPDLEWQEVWNELSSLSDSQAIERELDMIENDDLEYLTMWALSTPDQAFNTIPIVGQCCGAAVGPGDNVGKVNSEFDLLVKSHEIQEFDYREGKMKHYYEVVFNENGIIVIRSIDSDDTLAVSVKHSGLKQDIERLNELLSIQEQKLISSDVNDKRVYKIYKIYFPNGKVYIGQTIQTIEQRFRQELTSAFTEGSKEYNYPFSRALRKYLGEDLSINQAFEKSKELGIYPELWHVCADQQDANNAEKFWIGYYHSQFDEFGYNVLEGGLGGGQAQKIIKFELLERALKNGLISNGKRIVKENVINYLNNLKDSIKNKFGLTYRVSEYILDNSIRAHYGDSMSFDKKKTELIQDILLDYLKRGYNPSEIKAELGISEGENTISNWIKELVLNNKINSIDIVISRALREYILNGELSGAHLPKNLPGVPNINKREWIITQLGKLSQVKKDIYIIGVIRGIIEECHIKQIGNVQDFINNKLEQLNIDNSIVTKDEIIRLIQKRYPEFIKTKLLKII